MNAGSGYTQNQPYVLENKIPHYVVFYQFVSTDKIYTILFQPLF
jgi:hypothetical protein